jgi:transcription initiation factor IIE alpha subunit
MEMDSNSKCPKCGTPLEPPDTQGGPSIERIDAVIAEWQQQYDRLAGVPERAS